MATIKPFSELIQIGNEAEDKFEAYLLWHGIKYRRLGQENWLPKWIHGKLRFNYELPVEVLRHIPDFSTEKSIIQVKNAPDCTEYPTVTLQKSSYEVAQFYANLDIPTFIFWMYPDKKFYGNWVKNITPENPSKPRNEFNGSQTPMLLVRKSQLVHIDEFLRSL